MRGPRSDNGGDFYPNYSAFTCYQASRPGQSALCVTSAEPMGGGQWTLIPQVGRRHQDHDRALHYEKLGGSRQTFILGTKISNIVEGHFLFFFRCLDICDHALFLVTLIKSVQHNGLMYELAVSRLRYEIL